MCYMVLLSTDSPTDLSVNNDALVIFSPDLPGLAEEEFLEHKHKWFVGSRSRCSCGFRHLYVESADLGFGEPVDWYPEEPEDLDATKRFIGIIRKLSAQGAKIDCIDAWDNNNEIADLSGTVHVCMSQIKDTEFRFFENYRIVFEKEPNQQIKQVKNSGA